MVMNSDKMKFVSEGQTSVIDGKFVLSAHEFLNYIVERGWYNE